MRKKAEFFFFFSIVNPPNFKKALKQISKNITSASQIINNTPSVMVNIAFSRAGLANLGVEDTLGDPSFSAGQFADAENLGDPGTDNWVEAFKGTNVHGAFLLVSATNGTIFDTLATITSLFGSSINELYRLQSQLRPGTEAGHERKCCSSDIRAITDSCFRLWLHGWHQPARN